MPGRDIKLRSQLCLALNSEFPRNCQFKTIAGSQVIDTDIGNITHLSTNHL